MGNLSSLNLPGKLIRWITPLENRNYANLKESFDGGLTGDYITLNENDPCQKRDGSLPDFTGAIGDFEWLINAKQNLTTGHEDTDVYIINSDKRVTNISDPVWPNYHQYLETITAVRRDNSEILPCVDIAEYNANLSLYANGIDLKINALMPAITEKIAKGASLSPTEQTVYDLQQSNAAKVILNADNAENLRNQILAGGTPNIKSGWNYTPEATSYPFV